MIKRILLSIIAALTLINLAPIVALADTTPDPCGGVSGSAYCEAKSSSGDPFGPDGLVTNITQILVVAAGIVSVIGLILGGISFITSSGDAQKVKRARTTIIYAAIGVVISLLAQGVVSFILDKI